jgi:pimeloyl-ACP methyl ester carboxylesterase
MNKLLVTIHGFNSTSNSFNYIIEKLKWKGEILRIDYDSHRPLEETLKYIQGELPNDRELILVGHSLGGVISVLLAHMIPDNIHSVITISSPIGGSKAATFARWLPWSPEVFKDITPSSSFIRAAQVAPTVPVSSIITSGGTLALTNEPNDSVVTVASQQATPAKKKAELKANHFEVLMHPTTIRYIEHFLDITPL